MRIWLKIKDFYYEHPSLDWVVFLAAAGATHYFKLASLLPGEEARIALHAGVATICGLVLAAATFIASMTYQSANILMAKIRDVYSDTLKRNWRAIIQSSLLSAVIALLMLFFDGGWAVALSVGLLGLVVARGKRAISWLMLTLFSQEISNRIPEKLPVPPPIGSSAAR